MLRPLWGTEAFLLIKPSDLFKLQPRRRRKSLHVEGHIEKAPILPRRRDQRKAEGKGSLGIERGRALLGLKPQRRRVWLHGHIPITTLVCSSSSSAFSDKHQCHYSPQVLMSGLFFLGLRVSRVRGPPWLLYIPSGTSVKVLEAHVSTASTAS